MVSITADLVIDWGYSDLESWTVERLDGRPLQDQNRYLQAVADPQEQRPPMAVALEWVSRITTVALEMVLPGLGGYWVDSWLGTPAVFTILGFGIGGSVAMWHLIRITKSSGESSDRKGRGGPP